MIPSFRTALWQVGADGAVATRIGQGMIDGSARVSPDGTKVVFARQFFNDDWVNKDWPVSLVIRDLATGAERRVLPDDRVVGHPDWSPDGRSVIYNTDSGTDHSHLEITSSFDAAAMPRLLDPGAPVLFSWAPTFAPDGSRICSDVSRASPVTTGCA